MGIESYQRAVSTSVTQLTTETGAPRRWRVANHGSNSVFIGGPTVTSTNGFELKSTDVPIEIMVPGDDVLYAVCTTGTSRVDVFTP